MKHIQAYKLDPKAVLPTRTHETDAGLDIYALNDVFIPLGESRRITTGIALEILPGYVGKLEGRSSMNLKGLITAGGVIDAGYSGSIDVTLHNFSARGDSPFDCLSGYDVKAGEKVA